MPSGKPVEVKIVEKDRLGFFNSDKGKYFCLADLYYTKAAAVAGALKLISDIESSITGYEERIYKAVAKVKKIQHEVDKAMKDMPVIESDMSESA